LFTDAEELRDIVRQISSSSFEESPVSPRDSISSEEVRSVTKKIYDAAKLLGGKTVQCNFVEVSMKLSQAKQVAGGNGQTRRPRGKNLQILSMHCTSSSVSLIASAILMTVNGSSLAPSSLYRMGDLLRSLKTTAGEWRFIEGTPEKGGSDGN
jgi:hypothetical protein